MQCHFNVQMHNNRSFFIVTKRIAKQCTTLTSEIALKQLENNMKINISPEAF